MFIVRTHPQHYALIFYPIKSCVILMSLNEIEVLSNQVRISLINVQIRFTCKLPYHVTNLRTASQCVGVLNAITEPMALWTKRNNGFIRYHIPVIKKKTRCC